MSLAHSPAASHPGVVLLAGTRTPVTGRSRAQGHLRADELAATVVSDLAARAAVAPAAVVLGNCTGPGGNLGRLSALGAGLGQGTVGWTVDAQCGSGMLAVQQGAEHVSRTGHPVVAGGAESPSTAPQRLLDGVPYQRAPFAPEGFADPEMTVAAEDLAQRRKIGRDRQDAYAVRSHRLALESAALSAREVTGALRGIPDDGPRTLSVSLAARFAPVLGTRDTLTVTPATAARIADGAAAVLAVLAGAEADAQAADPAGELSAPCLLRSSVLTGGDPALPGIAPVAAVRAALDQAGVSLEQVRAVEVVEAYAAQVLAVLDELGLAEGRHVDPRVNAAGGALALGHPWGASGALAVVRLMHRLDGLPPGSLGVAACAIAGGMGAAVVLERLHRKEQR